METHSGAGSLPARRPPGGVEPGNLADQGPGEGPPVHLTGGGQPVAVLESLLIARGDRLLRAAVMLAGGQADGEDLLQAALERVYRHWGRINGDPEGYLRRTLYHLAADGWRRNGLFRARLGLLHRSDGGPDETAAVDQRDELIRLLRGLPPRQRTAVILRYWEELSEAETARLMGCSVGNVKSAASRGLRRLRELSGEGRGGGEERGRTSTAPADTAPAARKSRRQS
jgi:RNA polymerase sigma-70 factor (sigma-E family)